LTIAEIITWAYVASGILIAFSTALITHWRNMSSNLGLRLLLGYLVCFCVYGFGHVLQPIIEEILQLQTAPWSSWSSIYTAEFALPIFLHNAFNMMLLAAFPSALLFLYVKSHPKISVLHSAVAGGAALAVGDLLLTILNQIFVYHHSMNWGFGFSLVADFVGGPVAGILSRAAINRLMFKEKRSEIRLFVQVAVATLGGALLILILIYLFLFHTYTQEINAVITHYDAIGVMQHREDNLEASPDTELEKILKYTSYHFSDPTILSPTETLLSSESPIHGKVYAFLNCDEGFLRKKAKQKSLSGGVEEFIDNRGVTTTGVAQEYMLQTKRKAEILIPSDAWIVGGPDKVNKEKTYRYQLSNGGVKIAVPIQNGDAIIFNVMPGFDATKLHDPNPLASFTRPEIVFNSKGAKFNVPLINSECKSVDLASKLDSTGTIKMGDHYTMGSFIFLVSGLSQPTELHGSIDYAQITVPQGHAVDLLSKNEVASVEIKGARGKITVGEKDLLLTGTTDLLIRGKLSLYHDNTTINVSGSSRYILINGELVSYNIWKTFRDQLALPTIIFAALALLFNGLLRKWFYIIIK